MPKEDECEWIIREMKTGETNRESVLKAAQKIAPDMRDGYSGMIGGYMNWSFHVETFGLIFRFCWNDENVKSAMPAYTVMQVISQGLKKPFLLGLINDESETQNEKTIAIYGKRIGDTFNAFEGKDDEGRKLGILINSIHNGYCDLMDAQSDELRPK